MIKIGRKCDGRGRCQSDEESKKAPCLLFFDDLFLRGKSETYLKGLVDGLRVNVDKSKMIMVNERGSAVR